jgi:hypothetical protein
MRYGHAFYGIAIARLERDDRAAIVCARSARMTGHLAADPP